MSALLPPWMADELMAIWCEHRLLTGTVWATKVMGESGKCLSWWWQDLNHGPPAWGPYATPNPPTKPDLLGFAYLTHFRPPYIRHLQWTEATAQQEDACLQSRAGPLGLHWWYLYQIHQLVQCDDNVGRAWRSQVWWAPILVSFLNWVSRCARFCLFTGALA